tara:strand:- start:1119 stop:1739 length:621 start_codon:yes stop_codon:yes gene_type:complete
MISIIDYGNGNLAAFANIFKQLKVEFCVTSDHEKLKNSDKYILPGVGAFDSTMKNLRRLGLDDLLTRQVIENKKKILGICIGMHILADWSEEGVEKGLGFIKGNIRKFNSENLYKKDLYLPHMGWNSVNLSNSKNHLLRELNPEKGFYFLHNYYFFPDNNSDILATFNYGDEFPCVVCNSNIYGIQFHPEKSQDNGLIVIRNFASL